MKGTCIRFYMHENDTCHHVAVYEWLLEQGKKLNLHGGSAFRAIAGFGRHGILHEDRFFEMAGDLPVMVEFVLSDEEAESLLMLVRAEELKLFYMRSTVEFEILNGEP